MGGGEGRGGEERFKRVYNIASLTEQGVAWKQESISSVCCGTVHEKRAQQAYWSGTDIGKG